VAEAVLDLVLFAAPPSGELVLSEYAGDGLDRVRQLHVALESPGAPGWQARPRLDDLKLVGLGDGVWVTPGCAGAVGERGESAVEATEPLAYGVGRAAEGASGGLDAVATGGDDHSKPDAFRVFTLGHDCAIIPYWTHGLPSPGSPCLATETIRRSRPCVQSFSGVLPPGGAHPPHSPQYLLQLSPPYLPKTLQLLPKGFSMCGVFPTNLGL